MDYGVTLQVEYTHSRLGPPWVALMDLSVAHAWKTGSFDSRRRAAKIRYVPLDWTLVVVVILCSDSLTGLTVACSPTWVFLSPASNCSGGRSHIRSTAPRCVIIGQELGPETEPLVRVQSRQIQNCDTAVDTQRSGFKQYINQIILQCLA
jgi:hypothetical protein